MDVNVAINL